MGLKKIGSTWYYRECFTAEIAKKLGLPKDKLTSLRTKDRAEALEKMKRLEIEHQRRLYAAKLDLMDGLKKEWKQRWFPRDGLYTIGDRNVVAAGDKIMIYRADKTLWKTFDNTFQPSLGTLLKFSYEKSETPHDVSAYYVKNFSRKTAAAADFNQQVFNAWIQKANPTAPIKRDAQSVFDAFAAKFPGLTFKDCTKAQARQLLQDYRDAGLAPQTVQKKIGFLKSAVNVAIDDETMFRNPFSKLMDRAKIQERRLSFSEEDMRVMIENSPILLSAADQILFLLLHKTGMRMAEAWGIDREFDEDGLRYVRVGTKTESSDRRLPLPDACPKINGRYQTGTAAAASKRINRFINACGITDADKVAHSFRHRAKDRMTVLQTPVDQLKRIMGHTPDITDRYGSTPPPMSHLKPWIDLI